MKITPLDHWIHKKISSTSAQVTRAEIDAWQLQKINQTLALARSRSAFYRKHLEGTPVGINSLQDFQRFPFSAPEDVRRNPLAFVCVSQDEIQRVVTLQSTGTTGEPKRIYFTSADQELTIDFFGVGMNTLTTAGQRALILLPGETPGSVGDLLRLGLLRQGRIPIPHGPVRDPMLTLQIIHDQKIDCLVGSPTQILGLARRWQPGKRHPSSILLSTDHVPDSIVRFLEETWGCTVYNHYGATEMGLGGGVECEAHNGYHLREADLYFEIIDPLSGAVLPEGEQGEVVLTTLTRQGMPLIRYRMGDSSRFIPGYCSCGTQLRNMDIVRGRYSGFIPLQSVPGGETVLKLPEFDEALFAIPGLLNFSLTVRGSLQDVTVQLETQRLTETPIDLQVQAALAAIPAIQNCKISIQNQVKPTEPGSILKRIIIDKRGEHA